MMADVLALERRLDQFEREFSTWRRDAATRPIRQSAPAGVMGHMQFAVLREIGEGTEPYVMVQRLKQISTDQRWAFASATYEQVACFGDLVSAEYKPFVCTVAGEYAVNQGFTAIPLIRANLSWIALPWTPMEIVAIEDVQQVARTDAFPPIGGEGGGVPSPLTGGGDGEFTPAVLNDLTDCTVTGDQGDNEVFAWDAASTQGTYQTLAEAGIAAAGHTHVEADITDLDHYATADFTTDFAAESLANLTTRAITDLSDVAAKTGTGTTIVFNTSPVFITQIASPKLWTSGNLVLDAWGGPSGDTSLTIENSGGGVCDVGIDGTLSLADNKALLFGDGGDATFQYDGTNLLVDPKAVGAGAMRLTADAKLEFRAASAYVQSPSTGVIRLGVSGIGPRHEFYAGAVELMRAGATGMVFNESGEAAIDTRIEGDTKDYLFFADAGNDSIGINQSAPGTATYLNVVSDATGRMAALFQRDVAGATVPVVQIVQDRLVAPAPALEIKQDDISEGFINFASSTAGSDRGAVPTSTVDSVASARVEHNGTVYVVALHADQ